MKIFKKSKKIAIASVLLACTFSANAAVINFGGATPTDGSLQTAGSDARLANIQWVDGTGVATTDITNIIDPASGFFIETFDQATVNPILAQQFGPGILPSDLTVPDWVEFTSNNSGGCSVNSGTALDVSSSPSGAGLGVQLNNSGSAAHANQNASCFAFAPQLGEGPDATVTIDYSNFLVGTPFEGESLGYVGLYYGSIDDYNSLSFGNLDEFGNFVAIDIDGFGTELDGLEILQALNLPSGDRDRSNRFINIFFDDTDDFTAIQFTNTLTRAFEVDNIVVGVRSVVTEVSEPSILAILGLGIMGMGLFSRRKKM